MNTLSKTASKQKKTRTSNLISKNALFLIISIAIILFFGAIITDSFFDLYNLSRVARQLSISGLLAIGMTFVIIGGNGGIDLSVGSTFGLATMASISFQNELIKSTGSVDPYPGLNLPLIIIILFCLGIGASVGIFNGVGVIKLKIPPFIMTLSTLSIVRGIVLVYSNGYQLMGVRKDFKYLGTGMVGNIIPIPLIFFIIVVIISFFYVHKSRYGRALFATGTNIKAARISGIKTNMIIMSTYIISGMLAALAAILFTAFTTVADPWAGSGYETDAISSVLIGGTTMLGGKGTIMGTVYGLLFIGLMKNLLTHLNINSYIQQMITGLLIIGVVTLSSRGQNRKYKS